MRLRGCSRNTTGNKVASSGLRICTNNGFAAWPFLLSRPAVPGGLETSVFGRQGFSKAEEGNTLMARLFMTHNGVRYEKKFGENGKPFWADPTGKVLDESLAQRPVQAHRGQAMDLTESDSERARQIRRDSRDRKRKAAALSESTRQQKRVEMLKGAGMPEKEAQIAARGRSIDPTL